MLIYDFLMIIKRDERIAKTLSFYIFLIFFHSVGYSTFPCCLLASYANVCWTKPS